MKKFITVEELEKLSNHTHDFKFYDNYSDTFDEVLNENHKRQNDPTQRTPIGTVWECECGAREIRFIVWTGKYDIRKEEVINNQ